METTVINPAFSAFKADKQISFVRPYDAKSTGIDGFRHAVIRYRDTTKGVAAKPAKMVTIPQVKLPDEYSLMPEKAQRVFTGIIEDTQNELIRAMIDANVSVIEWQSVSINEALEYLTAAQVSQRLTKEQIEAWFGVAMFDATKQRGMELAQAKQVAPVLADAFVAKVQNNYKERFSKLAAPVPNLSQTDAQHLVNLLKVSKVDDDISRALSKRLNAILNPEVIEGVDL